MLSVLRRNWCRQVQNCTCLVALPVLLVRLGGPQFEKIAKLLAGFVRRWFEVVHTNRSESASPITRQNHGRKIVVLQVPDEHSKYSLAGFLEPTEFFGR